MEGNRSWRRTEGIQIDFSNLTCRLRQQWKRMAVCALIFAVLAGGYSYLADTGSSAGSEAEQLTTVDEEETVAPVTDTVQEVKTKEEQIQGVVDAVYLTQEIERLEEYMDCSILMQVDPYHKNHVILLYSIENAPERSVQKITESYLSYLANGGAADALQKADQEWSAVESSYLAEMFNVSQKPGGTDMEILLSVEVTGKDAAMAGKLASSIQGALKDYSRTVRELCGSHTLSLVSNEAGERLDAALLAQQREKHTQQTANRTGLKMLLDGFDEEQKKMYQMQNAEDYQADACESWAEIKESIAAESQMQGDPPAAVADDGLPEEETAGTDAVQQRGISVLYVLLGFLGGIFTYSMIYAVWYVAQGTIKSAREFRLYYAIPFYGSVSTGQLHRKNSDLLNRIRLFCMKHHINEILLAAEFTASPEEKDVMQELICQMQECGIHALFTEKADTDPSIWETLPKDPAVLLLCGIDRTAYQRVDEVMEFYLENNVRVLGASVWESQEKNKCGNEK